MADSTSSGASTDPSQAPTDQRSRWPGRRALWALLPALGLCVSLGLMATRNSEVWQRELEGALVLAREQGKPLHVHFSRSDVPLAQAMDETLALEPVRQIAQTHFINLRLDARSQSELFQRFIGSAGALASCIVDLDASGQPDVVAVLPGYQDADRCPS